MLVTGTRASNRTQFETLAPVDVFTKEDIKSVESTDLKDVLAQLVPSFVVQRLPMADGQVFVRPATLRGLSPDQTLVLVNGRRFHRSALLGNRGAQAAELAQIPTSAIKRIEVLRDGASVTLEPAGQLELSGAALETIHQTCVETGTHLNEVAQVAGELQLGFLGMGFQPKWKRDEMPWMPKGRYKIMRA
ncbi:hypothetical protein G6F63_014519 [Rhizopus arrhizus]|nr:hypothetical protein G6F63_014519 [Rhizopus arrhizus]